MNVVQIQELSKTFGVETILSQVSFFLQEGEKVGLVGANGTGKSTLLKIIAGREEADSGQVVFAKGALCGYLAQEGDCSEDNTMQEELLTVFSDLADLWQEIQNLERTMSMPEVFNHPQKLEQVMEKYSLVRSEYERRNGYAVESKIRGICTGLGFELADLSRQINSFSGGQKTRIALAKLLLQEPSLLLLDEPTNHLDLQSCEWLEEYLCDYPGAVLVVSHDRYFLDRVAERIIELSEGKIRSYPGNYSEFLQQKEKEKAAQEKNYELYQAKVKKLEEYIRRNRAGVNAKQARGRASLLEKLKPVERPKEEEVIRFTFYSGKQTGEKVVELNDLEMGYGGNILFSKLKLMIRRGERVGLIGPNGVGKSTLLKILARELVPLKGEVIFGKNVQVGYYDQEQRSLNPHNTIIEEIRQVRPMSEEEARNFLAGFLFCEDDVFKPIQVLSGGEKTRVLLAKLLLMEGNLLILDEPTNHLDIKGKEVLEAALQSYNGTVIIVSHDRYFLDQTIERILELDNGKLTDYPGDYTYYRWKKEQMAQSLREQVQESKKEGLSCKTSTVPKKQIPRLTPEQIMERIEAVEIEMAGISQALASTETYEQPVIIKELSERYEALNKELESLYSLWEEIS